MFRGVAMRRTYLAEIKSRVSQRLDCGLFLEILQLEVVLLLPAVLRGPRYRRKNVLEAEVDLLLDSSTANIKAQIEVQSNVCTTTTLGT